MELYSKLCARVGGGRVWGRMDLPRARLLSHNPPEGLAEAPEDEGQYT